MSPSQGESDLNFVTFGEHTQLVSTRAIRSHAAKVGWQVRKRGKSTVRSEHSPAGPQLPLRSHGVVVPSTSVARSDDVDHFKTPYLSSASSQSSSSANSSCPTPLTYYSPPELITSRLVVETSLDAPTDEDYDVEEIPWQSQDVLNNDLSLLKATKDRLVLPIPRPVGQVNDPFSQFPVRWEPSFDSLVQFYRFCASDAWLKIIKADWGEEGNCEFKDYPLRISIVNSEPAMFYAVMSNASLMAPPSNTISMRQQPFLSQWLRLKAIKSLREAIADPDRAYTDAVICTVSFVYLNEALRGGGEEAAQKFHGPALVKMVETRGGLPWIATGGRDGLILSRMLGWSDRIVAATLGIPLLFPDFSEDPSVDQTQWSGIWSRVKDLM